MKELHPRDPRQVGAYRLAARLGSGGMGVVYLARDRHGADVALKVAHPALAEDDEFRQRFAIELDHLYRLDSPWIAKVLAGDPDGNPPWLACRYVPGPTLAQAISVNGPLDRERWGELAVGLGHALSAIHGVGLIHRDLKPANVLLSPDGPRIVDFGIARLVDDVGGTAPGFLVGSTGWLSPEQLRDLPLTPATDMFAAGLLLAYAGTGRPAYGNGGLEAIAVRVLTAAPDLAGLDPQRRGLVEALLRGDPTQRPTARDLVRRVDATADTADTADTATLSRPTTVMPVPAPRRPAGVRSRRTSLISGVAAVLVVLAGLGLVWRGPHHSSPASPVTADGGTTATSATRSDASGLPLPEAQGHGALTQALSDLGMSTSGLVLATQQLVSQQSMIGPALQAVRSAAESAAQDAHGGARNCPAIGSYATDAMNAAVSLTSNTGAAVHNAVGSVQKAAATTTDEAEQAEDLGASARDLARARAGATAADRAATQADSVLQRSEANASAYLMTAQSAAAGCN